MGRVFQFDALNCGRSSGPSKPNGAGSHFELLLLRLLCTRRTGHVCDSQAAAGKSAARQCVDNASPSDRPLVRHRPLDAPPRIKGRRSDPQKFVVDVKASRIDGQGAFAAEAIPARRKIGEIRGESLSVREARKRARGLQRIMIVEVSARRAIDASNSSDPLRFTNHSCRPNAVLRIRQGRVEFYAMREVERGEEITVNYGETHHDGQLRCRCGAVGCVGRL